MGDLKKIIHIITLIFISSFLFSAPQLKFNKLVHDFGFIEPDSLPQSFSFKYMNTGDKKLRILKVKPS